MKDPDALRSPIASVAPRGEDLLLPGACRGNDGRCLWSGYKYEIEAALQVVCLQATAYGCGDLEGGLAERYGGKGNIGRGNESDSLMVNPKLAWHPWIAENRFSCCVRTL